MFEPNRSSSFGNSGPVTQSVERLRREFERWLETAMQQGGRALDAVGLRGFERSLGPAIDIVETPNEVFVDVDLPGVDPAMVDVSLLGDMLTIQVPKRVSALPEGAVAHLQERMQGSVQRSVPMPAPVVPDSVSADLKNGVLRIRLQKSDKARPTKIPIRTEPPVIRPADLTTPRTPYNTGL